MERDEHGADYDEQSVGASGLVLAMGAVAVLMLVLLACGGLLFFRTAQQERMEAEEARWAEEERRTAEVREIPADAPVRPLPPALGPGARA
jgi:hypothetical protein